jgi:hypothetical protein
MNTPSSPSAQTALAVVAKQTKTPRSSKNSTRRKGNCNNCGKPGHCARDCREKKVLGRENPKDNFLFSACRSDGDIRPRPQDWLFDSGACSHMVVNLGLLQETQRLDPAVAVTLGDGHQLRATHRGMIKAVRGIILNDVLYVPEQMRMSFIDGKGI